MNPRLPKLWRSSISVAATMAFAALLPACFQPSTEEPPRDGGLVDAGNARISDGGPVDGGWEAEPVDGGWNGDYVDGGWLSDGSDLAPDGGATSYTPDGGCGFSIPSRPLGAQALMALDEETILGTWRPPLCTGGYPLSYEVQLTLLDGGLLDSVAAASPVFDTKPPLQVEFRVSVRALNPLGPSAPDYAPGTFLAGHFWPTVVVSRADAGGGGYGSLVAGDINNDGYVDLVLGGEPIWSVLGTPDGGFGRWLRSTQTISSRQPIALVDVNGDGYLDVVSANLVAMGDGTGNFLQPYYWANGDLIDDWVAADFTGTGHTVIVSVDRLVRIETWSWFDGGLAQGASVQPPALQDGGTIQVVPGPLLSGDFLGTGKVGFAFFGYSPDDQESYLGVMLGQSDGGIGVGSVQPSDHSWPMLSDVVPGIAGSLLDPMGTSLVYYADDALLIYQFESGGGLTRIIGPDESGPSPIGLGDVNGDGWNDLVSINRGDPYQVVVSYNHRDGGFWGDETYALSGQGIAPEACLVTDLNQDGHPDLACANASAGGGGIVVPGVAVLYGR